MTQRFFRSKKTLFLYGDKKPQVSIYGSVKKISIIRSSNLGLAIQNLAEKSIARLRKTILRVRKTTLKIYLLKDFFHFKGRKIRLKNIPLDQENPF